MKLPSVQLLSRAFIKVAKRFPFVLVAALAGTVACIALTEGNYNQPVEINLIKLAMVSSLGLPLFFAIHLFCEKWSAKPMFKFIALITGLFLLVQFYYSLPPAAVNNGNALYRFFFWSAGMHLIVAFSVFFVVEELNGFWQFNKQLFLRFLTAALYSGVLYLGLAGALLAVEELFNLHIDHDLYINLWNVIAGLFNTVFFLGGIEDPVEDLNNQHSYPKGLKIFTQYVLLPLVTVYLVILYAYTAKIMALRSLPQGWVTNLILGFSVTGILSLLLVWPLREQEENKWIKTFTRFFYFSLVPLITLLFIAIGTRINAYGVTIERYIVAMLGVWLALITLYFIFSRRKNIILIPLTLALFLFGSCFGPWGMFAVAERSQVKRLKALLEKNYLLVNGKLVRESGSRPPAGQAAINQISSIIEYLADKHSLQAISDWMSEDCRKMVLQDSLSLKPYEQASKLEQYLWNYTVEVSASDDNLHSVVFDTRQLTGLTGQDISGYTRIYNFSASESEVPHWNYDYVKDAGYTVLANNQFSYYINDQLIVFYDMAAINNRLLNQNGISRYQYSVNAGDMIVETTDKDGQKAKILFEQINVNKSDSAASASSVDGYIMLSR